MSKILVHEFITVDGVIESPAWTMDYPFDPEPGNSIGRLTGSSEAVLLGRRTFEMFARAWPGRTVEDDPGAPFFNESPKYVVSGTLQSAEWNNSTILGPYDAKAIAGLKEQLERNIYVSGSAMLVRQMITDGLVDELHLFVYPLRLGSGDRLFAEGDATTTFTLAEAEAYDSGVLHLAYGPAR